jgi:hypothetical protein
VLFVPDLDGRRYALRSGKFGNGVNVDHSSANTRRQARRSDCGRWYDEKDARKNLSSVGKMERRIKCCSTGVVLVVVRQISRATPASVAALSGQITVRAVLLHRRKQLRGQF